jgi:hypothetical protein
MNDRDIWRTANLMIGRFGKSALNECALRVERQKTLGDDSGAYVWSKVLYRIVLLSEFADSCALEPVTGVSGSRNRPATYH